ncbi:MAG: hypothetical protein H7346_05005 [Burkholderiaceae bacterium]|nr:hypothetical protein [Burkholderiaceae bacterium]
MNLLTRISKGAALPALSIVLSAALLSACGGGDSAPAATASVSGVAATGAAIASGIVTLKCVSGTTAAATTGTDGSFTVDVSAVTLPCVARVEYKDAGGVTRQLHSVITAAGTANITSLTDLLVAKLANGGAAAAFDTFTATTGRAITAAQIKAAAGAVKAYHDSLGVDVTNFPADPIGAKFVAKNGSTDGDAVDKILDALKTKLGTKSLADAETEINKTSTSTGGGSTGTSTSTTNTVIISANSARNGTYTLVGARYSDSPRSTDFGFTGEAASGSPEAEVTLSASGAVKRAHIWFVVGSGHKFFGCDNSSSVTCAAISYNATTGIINFNGPTWVEVNTFFGSSPDTAVSAGETLTINGTLDISK